MKKVLYILIIGLFTLNVVYAFDIDMDQIDINAKSKELIKKLDSSYAIDTDDFDKTIVNDEKIVSLAKEVTRLVLSKQNFEQKYQDFSKNYLFLSSTNGFDTLSGSIFVKNFLTELDEKKIEADYFKDVKIVEFNDSDVLAFVYLPDVKIDDDTQDLILAYWMKEEKGVYKVFFPWLTYSSDLENYFAKISQKEKTSIIGDSFKKISLTSEESKTVSKEILTRIFESTKYSNVQITAMKDTGVSAYGSGFIIRKGIVATTWSNFEKLLTNGNYFYVSDCDGNVYNVEGIVALQVDYDIVLLKLTDEVLQEVKLGDSTKLKTDDNLFIINSKSNGNFSINYGSFITMTKGRLKNLLALASGDVGSALYNADGEVVGFNTADALYADLSYANDISYLQKVQTILTNQAFADIKYVLVDDFKINYYRYVSEEKHYNKLTKESIKYQQVGDVLETINLPLVKASFKDNILSLRYKNETGKMLDSLYLVSNYIDKLKQAGFALISEDGNKQIYSNDQYKVIIKNNLSYLIVLIMEK